MQPICTTASNGSKFWYLNGKRHRTDGPACEYANGNKEWYLNGVFIRNNRSNNKSQEVHDWMKEGF